MRRLLLALLAAGLGFFAAALLRAERRMGRDERAPAAAAASCAGRTRDGAPCSRPPQPGSDRCWQHQGQA